MKREFQNTDMETRKKIIGIFAVAFLGASAALGLNKLLFSGDSRSGSFEEKQRRSAQFASLVRSNGLPAFDFSAVAEVSTPAVVHIKTTIGSSGGQRSAPQQPMDPFDLFRNPFDYQMPDMPRQASGSGVIISDDGYIATNNHVVDGATKIEVVLNDKRSYVAEVIGTDPSTDLALLRITESGLPFIKFGNSDEVKVGQWVVAVGNPFNLTSTVTSGIVSALGRNIDLLRSEKNLYAIENFIQTDAAINPGNSGGALVNLSGELIGINTAIASNTGSYAGYGFAVPVNIVKKVMDDLKDFGKVQRAILGVSIQEITQELADEKGLKDLKGVYVAEVTEGGAAEKAGIKKGDVILKIGTEEVNSMSRLQETVGKHRPGDKINVTIRRDSEEKVLEATLRSQAGKTTLETAEKEESGKFMGMKLDQTTREERLNLKIKNGVKVSSLDKGIFKDAGIPDGFIITHIDNQPVYSVQGALSTLKSLSGAITIEGVTSGGTEKVFAVKIPKQDN